jgi:hypothetical protein
MEIAKLKEDQKVKLKKKLLFESFTKCPYIRSISKFREI